ncbi:MAG: hypothetical protein OXE50_13480 [Chloroflexi bacterium]|nr:hypothetical protein [Chloroflexota bacterium]
MRHTNDISLVLLYVICAALLVLVVAGWRVLSRPGAPDNRLLLLLKTHRWEALLLLGLPIAAGALDTALTVGALDTNYAPLWEHKHYVWRVLVLAALVVAYPRVRRQGSALLVLLWQLLMVLKAIGLAMTGVQDLLGYEGVIVSHEVYYGGIFDQTVPANVVSVTGVLRVLLVVWFMRLASRTSLGHAFLLLGLSMADPHTAPQLLAVLGVLDPWEFPFPLYNLITVGGGVAELFTQVGLNILMFWVLTRHETLGPRSMRSAAILLVAAAVLLPLVSSALLISTVALLSWLSFVGAPLSAGWTTYAIYSARQVAEVLLVALLAYLVRVRRPAGPSAGPGAPSP